MSYWGTPNRDHLWFPYDLPIKFKQRIDLRLDRLGCVEGSETEGFAAHEVTSDQKLWAILGESTFVVEPEFMTEMWNGAPPP